MNALIDTHVFIWWMANDPRLSRTALGVVGDPANGIYVSAATGWEIVIKAATGKLALPDEPDVYVRSRMAANRLQELPIGMPHALQTYRLPMHHRDPFDRILVAQSQVEDLPIITADPLIAQYDVAVIW